MIPSTLVFVRRFVRSCTRVTWKWSARLTRMKPQQQLLVFVAFIFLLLVYYGYNNLSTSSNIILLPVGTRTLQNYCNFPVNTNGAEGSLPGKDGDFQLEMVQAMVRHGDRSPFKIIPGMELKDLDCSMTPQNEEKKNLFSGYVAIVDYINVRTISPKAVAHDLVTRLDKCNNRGKMTQKGFQQLFETGKHLRKAYGDLIINGINNNQLYARSTNTDRTTQTVAALLYGFLEEKIIKRGQITINVSQDVFFREDNNGNVTPCPAYAKLMKRTKQSKEYRAGSVAMEPVMLEMSNLLSTPRKSLHNVIVLADACLVHICHGLSLPCNVGGCISQSTAFKLISYADWAFSHNYTQVADILSLPVLSQIATRMVDKSSSKTPIKFAVYGGHEITIISALISLGIYEQRWVPYASRLIFEFWKTTSVHNKTSEYIRVLFNGKTMTSKLTFCKENLIENGELCPLEEFVRWLGGGTFMETQKRYEQMCAHSD